MVWKTRQKTTIYESVSCGVHVSFIKIKPGFINIPLGAGALVEGVSHRPFAKSSSLQLKQIRKQLLNTKPPHYSSGRIHPCSYQQNHKWVEIFVSIHLYLFSPRPKKEKRFFGCMYDEQQVTVWYMRIHVHTPN